jgi:hypothetical protein
VDPSETNGARVQRRIKGARNAQTRFCIKIIRAAFVTNRILKPGSRI